MAISLTHGSNSQKQNKTRTDLFLHCACELFWADEAYLSFSIKSLYTSHEVIYLLSYLLNIIKYLFNPSKGQVTSPMKHFLTYKVAKNNMSL